MSARPTGNFNYPTPYRIGCGRIAELPEVLRGLEVSHPLIVADPGITGLSWFEGIVGHLRQAALEHAVFDGVDPNPTVKNVEDGVAVYRQGKHDGVVLIGGGSPMDAGKCVALLAHNPGEVFDYEDVGDNWKKADPKKIPPIVAVPTTAGTGSEVGRGAVIVDPRDHGKKIIFHPKLMPSAVVADPELTLGLPPGLTAATGMDALAHCFEALCAPGYHPMADGIALEGMRLIHENLVKVFHDGTDREARTHMMMAASMGATAFQKGLGLIHALSHPLGGATGLHHGTANAIFMPYVMVHNRPHIEAKMQRLGSFLGLERPDFDGVLQWVVDLRRDLGLPHTLEAAEGFDEAMAKRLAPLALQDPSLGTNPKSCTLEELEMVFVKSLRGDLS